MDRNIAISSNIVAHIVALRKESVDRNRVEDAHDAIISKVALRKESVDRNQGVHYDNYNLHVALRKESVDRNNIRHTTSPRPSSRSPQGERG